MESAHQPVSLAVHERLSPQSRSYSRPPDFRKSPDRPLSVASVSPVECLPATHYPLVTTHSPLTTFRINTCKSVSKQTTLTTFRINTYKKTGEGGPSSALPTTHRPLPTLPVPSLDCAYFLSLLGCTLSLAPPTAHYPLPTFCPPFCFLTLTNPFSRNPFCFTSIQIPGGVGVRWSVNSPLTTR